MGFRGSKRMAMVEKAFAQFRDTGGLAEQALRGGEQALAEAAVPFEPTDELPGDAMLREAAPAEPVVVVTGREGLG